MRVVRGRRMRDHAINCHVVAVLVVMEAAAVAVVVIMAAVMNFVMAECQIGPTKHH